MVASDNILEEKTICSFLKIWTPSEKPVYMPVYLVYEIPSNGKYFKKFVVNSV